VGQDLPPRWVLKEARARRLVARFAELACPPQLVTQHRTEQVISELELLLGAIQPTARRVLLAGFGIVGQRARVYPRSRGRHLTRLPDDVADAYMRMLMSRSRGVPGIARRLKGLLVMCYYQLPEVMEEIGYRPDEYIAMVSRRRLASYGAAIRAGERAVLAGTPLDPAKVTGSAPDEP
jgi:hypothetical protein